MIHPRNDPHQDNHGGHRHPYNGQEGHYRLQTKGVPQNAVSDQAPLQNPSPSHQKELRNFQSTSTGIEQSVSSVDSLMGTNNKQQEGGNQRQEIGGANLSSDSIVDSDGSIGKGKDTQCHCMMNWMLALFVISILSWVNISVHIYHGTVGKISGLILGYFFN